MALQIDIAVIIAYKKFIKKAGHELTGRTLEQYNSMKAEHEQITFMRIKLFRTIERDKEMEALKHYKHVEERLKDGFTL